MKVDTNLDKKILCKLKGLTSTKCLFPDKIECFRQSYKVELTYMGVKILFLPYWYGSFYGSVYLIGLFVTFGNFWYVFLLYGMGMVIYHI